MIVSTSVGGVPEVLPDNILTLCKPSGDDIVSKINQVIPKIDQVDKKLQHEQVKKMYSWHDVAERTEVVYDRLLEEEKIPLIDRLRQFYGCGLWAGKIFCIVVAVGYLIWKFYEWLIPRDSIEIARDIGERYKFIKYEKDDEKFKEETKYKLSTRKL